jgi:predicted nucleic acid-binding protein
MKLVVDANILVSGLIKDSVTRELMLNNELDLYTSDFIFIELFKHIKELAKKADMVINEFTDMAEILIVESGLKTITTDEVRPFIDTANKISPDIDDALYFSVALKLNCGIWSNDKELKKQNHVKVYSTSDLVKMLK